MGMQLPGWLRQGLEYAGYDWPASDEQVLADWAGQWDGLSVKAQAVGSDARSAVAHVTGSNHGPGADAFAAYMNRPGSNLAAVEDFSRGATAIATGCRVAAGIVLTMKLAVIAQLVTLALAIASVIATGGLAAGVALAAREVAKRLIEAAINLAVEQILAG